MKCFSVVLFLFFIVLQTASAQYAIAFGDSLSDTGNLQSMIPGGAVKLPYGRTHFKKATGRFSDGRLWLDFAVDAMGDKLLNPIEPYLSGNKKLDYSTGVNFAIAGATASDDNASPQLPSGISFTHQVESFKEFKKDCAKGTPNFPSVDSVESGVAIVLVGGNDINYMIMTGVSNDDIMDKIPDVVNAIKSGITELAKEGIKNFFVLNLPPQGCLPLYLEQKANSDPAYDSRGCLKDINKLSVTFNKKLMEMVTRLDVGDNIVFGDIFASAIELYSTPKDYGFDANSILQACCGSGSGTYNCDATKPGCGCSTSTVCKSLSNYINWDGVHFTEAFYRQLTELVINEFSKEVKGSNFLK